jgi:nitrile hydratase
MTELDRRTEYYLANPEASLPSHEDDPELLTFVNAVVFAGATAKRESAEAARFKVGDRVRVDRSAPRGHTRRARYIRGAVGEIVLAHGAFIYPDSAGNGLGEQPQHVYTLRFTGEELWGADHAEPNESVYFDVWDPYLHLAGSTEGALA